MFLVPRKLEMMELLADPYAMSDEKLIPAVEIALKSVCVSLLAQGGPSAHDAALNEMKENLQTQISKDEARDVASSLAYLRDRVGVPRDLPLASARQLRAHLNAAIDVLH
ncbi:hypothetical protein ACHAWT_009375 [Skeletonema menzelii]